MGNNQNQNVDMTHLKNIDQKLIEIIQSEVRHNDFWLWNEKFF